jgi:hypothetical protein
LRFDQEKSRLYLIHGDHVATKRLDFLTSKQSVFSQLLTRGLSEDDDAAMYWYLGRRNIVQLRR